MTDDETPPQILSLTPDPGWIASFDGGDEKWTEPLIGWAVVLYGHGRTGIEPVLLVEDTHPVTVREYREDHRCRLVAIRREPA